MVELLLSSGADINARNEDQQTPLIAMSVASFTEGVELLISKKADVNAKDRSGKIALHWAASVGAMEIADVA